MAMIQVDMTKRAQFTMKRSGMRKFLNVNLVMDEPQAPGAHDTLSHAISLYSSLRELWRQGSMAENGVVYVKVRGEFVELKVTRPKF